MALVFACAFAPCANAQETEIEAEARELTRLRMEFAESRIALQKMRVHYRNCLDQSARDDFEQFIAKEANSNGVIGLHLTRLKESVPVMQPEGRPSPLRLQQLHIEGGGGFYGMHRLLRRIAFYGEFVPDEFATLMLTAGKGAVSFDALVVQACWDESAEISHTPPPPGITVFEAEIATYRVELQEVRSARTTVTQLADRFQPMRLVNALAVVDRDWSPDTVLISEVHFAPRKLTMHGVALGESARSAVVASFRRPGLEETRIDWSVVGACHAFSATTSLGDVPSAKIDPLSKTIFDQRTSEFCNAR